MSKKLIGFLNLKTICRNVKNHPIQWLSWTGLFIITAILFYYDIKQADEINESSMTVVSVITKVDGLYIYYGFIIKNERYKSSFKLKNKHDGILSKGDKLYVRYAVENPEINFCIYPELRSANKFEQNSILDTLNSELVSGGWIGNNPHSHYSK